MGNSIPADAIPVQEKIHPKYKYEQLFVSKMNSSIVGKGQVDVVDAVLFAAQEQIPCVAKTLLINDAAEVTSIRALHKAFGKKFGKNATQYPDFIVQIFGIAQDASAYTIVMEKMAGSLFDVLYHSKFEHVRNKWTMQDRERLAMSCLQCVMDLHELGVVHRDIKPGNFLVDEKVTIVKLCDFGSIKLPHYGTTSNLKQFGGTLAYMAPERCTDAEDFQLKPQEWIASDLYSIGIVMCEILIGKRPFDGIDGHELLNLRKHNAAMMPFSDTESKSNPICFYIRQFLLAESSKRSTRNLPVAIKNASFFRGIAYIYEEDNVELGFELLFEAAASNVFACQLLCMLFRNRVYVEKDEKLAMEFSQSRDDMSKDSVSNNYVFSILQQYKLPKFQDMHLLVAFAYSEGWGCQKDYQKFFEMCYQCNSAHVAQDWLGWCYGTGNGAIQDYTKAIHWYKLSAEQGNVNAQNNLGFSYYNGNGADQDYAIAVKWYRMAAEQGHVIAQDNLGYCYQKGQGVPQNYAVAVHWYKLAADQNYANGLNNLAACLFEGIGTTKNVTSAIHMYKKAAAFGNALAQYNLGKV